MAMRLIYRMFMALLSWMVLCPRSNRAKEIEILVLRHTNWPYCNAAYHGHGCAGPTELSSLLLARLLPAHRRLGLLITPPTILRWHRQIVANRWTTRHDRGRGAVASAIIGSVGLHCLLHASCPVVVVRTDV